MFFANALNRWRRGTRGFRVHSMNIPYGGFSAKNRLWVRTESLYEKSLPMRILSFRQSLPEWQVVTVGPIIPKTYP